MKPKYTTYLAGPMEYTADNGLNWRLDYRKRLKPYSIKCVIPNLEEAKLIESPEVFNRYKLNNLPKYKAIMRQFIALDLHFVETVDFVLCRWAGEMMSGTVGEIQHAYFNDVPAYLVTSKLFHEVPGWFLACFTECFHSLDEFIEYFQKEKGWPIQQ